MTLLRRSLLYSVSCFEIMVAFDGIHLPGNIAGGDRVRCCEINVDFKEEMRLLVSGGHSLAGKPCSPSASLILSCPCPQQNASVLHTLQTFRTVLEII